MPRTQEIQVFTFEELSDSAKEHALYKYHYDSFQWSDEAPVETLKAFADVFPIKIKDWSYDSQSANASWMFRDYLSGDIENLTGIRLAKYIWNNYRKELFKPKFIGSLKTNEYVQHKRIKSPREPYANGNRFNPYYSGCQIDTSCVLTGCCFDEDILEPVYSFLKKPDATTDFNDLIQDCISNWEVSVRKQAEWESSMEYFAEICEINEYEFTESGERF